MKIFVFGSSLTSSYWNGAATYYRGIYKYLHALGHESRSPSPTSISGSRTAIRVPIDYAEVIGLPDTARHRFACWQRRRKGTWSSSTAA